MGTYNAEMMREKYGRGMTMLRRRTWRAQTASSLGGDRS